MRAYPSGWPVAPALLLALVTALAPAGRSAAPSDYTEMSLEELAAIPVYAASRCEQSPAEAPASVSIITADDFRKFGYRSLAEALRSVRGVYITYDRNYSAVGLRGFSRPGDVNSRVLVLVDGHRVTENIYDSSYLGNDFLIAVDLIERVEIVRGPGSSLFGSNAFFGVINVVTKHGAGLNGARVSVDAGSHGTRGGLIRYGRSFSSGVDLVLSGSLFESDGPGSLYFPEFDLPHLNHGRAIGLDYERSHQLFASLTWRDLSLQVAYGSRKKGVPTASYDSYFSDSREQTVDALGYVDLKLEHQDSRGLTVLARVNFNRYRYDGTYPVGDNFTAGPSDVALNTDDVLGQWLGAEFQLGHAVSERHRLTVGAEFRRNFNQDALNYDSSPYALYSDLHHRSSHWGVFGQDEWTPVAAVTLLIGLRQDHCDPFGSILNPRGALVVRLREGLRVKLLHGEAYRAPNLFETYVEDPSTRANPSLRPEKIRTTEFVVEQRIRNTFSLTASAYTSRIDDLVNQATDPETGLEYSENLDMARARGFEFELRGAAASGLRGSASLALQRTEDSRTGRRLDNSPARLGKLNLVLPLAGEVTAGVEVQTSSTAQTLTGKESPPYWLMNLTLSGRDLFKGLSFSASVYNLFDERYSVPGGAQHVQDTIEQDGRSIRVNVGRAF